MNRDEQEIVKMLKFQVERTVEFKHFLYIPVRMYRKCAEDLKLHLCRKTGNRVENQGFVP